MATRILSGDAARACVCRSFSRSARAVTASLGPAGRTVLADGRVLADGTSIALAMADESGAGSVGSRILKDTLFEADRDLGDGAARLACVADTILRSGLRALAGGVAPGALADGMLALREPVSALMAEERHTGASTGDIARAAGADSSLVELLETLPADVLQEGQVELRSDAGEANVVDVQSGFVFDVEADPVGFSKDERATDLVFDRVSVLVINEHLDDFADFARILEMFVSSTKSLCIVARGFGPIARATLAANVRGLRLRTIGLVPRDVGERAYEVLQDVAIATGATLHGRETGLSLANLRPPMLGRAERLTVRGERAVLARPGGDPDAVEIRSRQLRDEADRRRYLSLDRAHYQRRAARLTARWAEIRLGLRDAVDPHRLRQGRAALAALRAARDGVVPGGGLALGRLAAALDAPAGHGPTERQARQVVAEACRSVMRRIALNAGLSDATLLVGPHDPGRPSGGDRVFDVVSRATCPVDRWPVVDPLSTTLELLRRAISVASTILRVEIMVSA